MSLSQANGQSPSPAVSALPAMTAAAMPTAGPRFSIATPAFDALAVLRRCIGSVRGQRGPTHEHLVQDGGSSDGTPGWLAQQPLPGALSEPDRGMYDAIGRAWSRSRGEFLSWLNADEQYLPGTLQAVAEHFDANPDVDAVFGNYIVVNSQGAPVALRREIALRRSYVVNGFLNAASCTTFFRRRLLEQGLLTFDERYRYAADAALMIRLLDRGVRIGHLPRYLSLFGIDGSNLSNRPAAQAEIERLRLEHGAFRQRVLREAVLLGRRTERLLRGAYGSGAARYLYALDDAPNYAEVRADDVGGRYGLKDLEFRPTVMTPVPRP